VTGAIILNSSNWWAGQGYSGAQRNNYAVAPDGRILLSKRAERAAEQIDVVLNWFEELKRFRPAGKW